MIHKSLCLLILALATGSLAAQVAIGTYPYGTFDNRGFETINDGNLNMEFAIPILSKAGRGIPFQYALTYNGSIWQPLSLNGVTSWVPVSNFGWSGVNENTTGYVVGSQHSGTITYPANPGSQPPVYDTCTWTVYAYTSYIDTKGTPHNVGAGTVNTNCPSQYMSNTPSSSSAAGDGSGITLKVANYTSVSAIYPKGFQIPNVPLWSSTPQEVSPGTSEDSNGNEIIVNSNGQFTDTTGNVALTVAGTAPNPVTYTYTDTTGSARKVEVNYSTYTVQTKFGCSAAEYGPLQQYLVSSIVLGDGSSTYSFQYETTPGVPGNTTGRLASVELPTGGTISFSYSGGSNGIECSDGSTAGLTRTISATNNSAASIWTYKRSVSGTNFSDGLPCGSTTCTEVTDGLGNESLYDFVEPTNEPTGTTAQYYETERQVWQGAGSTSATTLFTRSTCYNASGQSSPCSATAFSTPISFIDTYETSNGKEMHGAEAIYDQYGDLTIDTIYDFGTSTARGSALGGDTYGYYMVGVPSFHEQVTGNDGGGSIYVETLYTYDGSTPTASSGVPNHLSVTGPRGNLTQVQQYYASGSYLMSSLTYEDTGSLLTSTGPNPNCTSGPTCTTTFSYDPTFVYNTGTSLPTPSSGVTLATSGTYDTSYTGLPLKAYDFNGQPTTFTSYDAMLRLTEQQFADGGETIYTYNSPTSLTRQSLLAGSAYAESQTRFDTYGRLSQTGVYNGQSTNPWYQQDTCYDGNGNANLVSYSYQGAGVGGTKVCTEPGGFTGGYGDTYTYDALGRVTRITHADGTSATYTYTGRDTRVTNENGVQRLTEVDGMGRPTVVCEISSQSLQGGGTPTTCGTTDITGAQGYATTYAYNLSTGTTVVTQGAQTRTFVIDWLGRPTSATEPESGNTTYAYSYNSTGLQVVRTRPTANQTGSSTTTTTYQYDSQGRPTSIRYSDGTPTKSYTYDTATGVSTGSGAIFTDLTQNNPKGRLSQALISGSAGSAYSYDAVGRIANLDECLPSGCGTPADNRMQAFTYDLSGDLLTSTDGDGVKSTFTVTPAAELQTLTSSLNNSYNPPNLVSSVVNGPNGPLSWSLGNGLYGVAQYDTMGRTAGGGVCSGITNNACSSGKQIYGFSATWQGAQLTGSYDSELNQTSTYGYDGFARLTSRNVTSGTTQNLNWTYDRYGNRWQQNVTSGSAPQPQLTFNTANNRVVSGSCNPPTASQYCYDAAGNMTADTYHTYTYDAEGDVTAVDGGSTATYVYDALNHRVRTVAGSTATEFVFNPSGQRVSVWNGTTRAPLRGEYFWGTQALAFYASGALNFQHQDWEGTERYRTSYNATVNGAFTSLPFGDAQTKTAGTDLDPYHFAMTDYDSETNTDHAQYRQYSPTEGRWLSPDPYSGSYGFSNPQSLNRYAYLTNDPMSMVDPSGQDGQGTSQYCNQFGQDVSGNDGAWVPVPAPCQYSPDVYDASYSGPAPTIAYIQGQTWQSIDSFLAQVTGNAEYTPLPTGLLNGWLSDAGAPGDIGMLGNQQANIAFKDIASMIKADWQYGQNVNTFLYATGWFYGDDNNELLALSNLAIDQNVLNELNLWNSQSSPAFPTTTCEAGAAAVMGSWSKLIQAWIKSHPGQAPPVSLTTMPSLGGVCG